MRTVSRRRRLFRRRGAGRPSLLLFALLLTASEARADAIGPPPSNCPRGTTPRSSHAGPECVKDPPKDCPNGWEGAYGGDCILHPCTSNVDCPADKPTCVEHSVCLQSFQDDYYDYNEDDREQHGELEPTRLLEAPGLLAGPPMPKQKRATPITRYNAVNLCSPEVPCTAPNTCQREKLCVPQGTRALAYRGTNISPIRIARKSAAPVTAGGDASPEQTAPPPGPPAEPTETTAPLPKKGGCAGCAAASSNGDAPWIALLGAAIAWVAIRRARGAFPLGARARALLSRLPRA
jgi:hypothetical protein